MSNDVSNQKYSVLMSIYDKEAPEFFDESLKSMLAQTVLPEQIVIVEDGLINEKLQAIISHYEISYPNLLTVVPLVQNSGLGNALNEGLKACRNELVARMDTDDISLPERCERELTLFQEHPGLSLVGTNIDEFIDNPNNIVSSRTVPSEEKDILKYSRRRNPFNHPTVMFRKSAVLKAGGYNPERRRAQDFELFVTMIHEGYHAMNINDSLLLFRANADSYGRKRNWAHCVTYMSIVYEFSKRGYSSFWDLIIICVGQTLMYITPAGMVKWLFGSFLRRKESKNIKLNRG